MKVEVSEYPSRFILSLTPEDIKEAALLVRLGMNHTIKTSVTTDAYRDGKIVSYVMIGNNKRQDTAVPKRK